jgi:hypothetical protein
MDDCATFKSHDVHTFGHFDFTVCIGIDGNRFIEFISGNIIGCVGRKQLALKTGSGIATICAEVPSLKEKQKTSTVLSYSIACPTM